MMMLKEIKDFIKKVDKNTVKYWEGLGKEVNSLRISDKSPLLIGKLAQGKNFKLTSKETEFLIDIIPEGFSNYIYYKGYFYKINYALNTATCVPKESIKENEIIFDFKNADLDSLAISCRAAFDLLNSALSKYENECEYDENNYLIEKVIEKEIDTSKYDLSYTLTKEQTENMRKWREEHNKKYHKKGFGYQGASPVSNFEIRFGSCSLGSYADCVCTKCYDQWKEETDLKKKDKIAKYMQYELFNNM